MFENKQEFKEDFRQRMIETYGSTAEESHPSERYMVLGEMVREYAGFHWKEVKTRLAEEHYKKVYYFSMEFLPGKSMKNNLMNLGIYDLVREGLAEMDISLDSIMDVEADAGLGNGGLGRLASCFMDSAATLNYPVNGNSIRYEYGLFRQRINAAGEQVELPDMWLRVGSPWEIRKSKLAVDVSYYGSVLVEGGADGKLHFRTVGDTKVSAVPYDVPMIGAGTAMTNTLRLWSAEPSQAITPETDYRQYLADVHEICQNVYPDDSTEHGKYLRLKQQYFFVSAGIRTIVKDQMRDYGTLDNLPDCVAIQLNDTHPVLAIPELMRILVDEYHYDWTRAWYITTHVMNYTNHTVLAEALETWPENYIRTLLPRVYMIIEEIDRQYCSKVQEQTKDADLVRRTRVLNNGYVQMAKLAVIGSNAVNGVAELHTQILKNDVFADFNRIYPNRITNKTNGVTPRRFLYYANPELCGLLDETIGPAYRKDAAHLAELRPYAENPEVQQKFLAVKKQRKEILAGYIKDSTGDEVSPDSIFDVMAKRLHAYKRQLLDIMQVIYLYQRMKADASFRICPHTYIFAAKAASSYVFAKKVIQLINCVARVVNRDPETSPYLKVVFLPDYRVSMSEILMPGADISEQISTAGKEASGTGNMKFMMNGAITLGTLDGANVEIDRRVGRENDVIFGLQVEQIPDYKKNYRAWDLYNGDGRIHKVMDSLVDGFWNGEADCFRNIYDELLVKNDEYLVLADFDAYVKAQEEIVRRYQDRSGWAKSCLINIAESGYFSSDRTIRQYAEETWHIRPLDFPEKPE